MVSTLKLYKEVMVNGTIVEAVPFPNEDHQAMLADYKYSASRMSNAPSITATLNYPTCLDAEWSDRVYVEFRGEKYYIKGVPSSSHDNSSNLYKHNLEFTSERIMLDSVYFFDVVQENSENDKPVANSADFSFYGTVKEFAERLNRSMLWSGIGGDGGYKVVIDSGVEFKDAMYTASNQYISDALKSMYETYELPYYFVGKEIHIGYAEKVIEDPLKYGAKNSLISVGKNYTNDKIVNKITGTGSDKNITYYYPNPTPKGVIALSGESADKYEIYDNKAFANKIDLERPFHSEIGVAEVKSATNLIPCFDNEYKNNVLIIGTRETYTEYSVEITFTARNSGTAMGYSVIPLKTIMTVNNKAVSLAPYFISGMLYDNAGNSWEVGLENGTNPTSFVTNDGIRYYGKTFTLKLMLHTSRAERVKVKVTGDVDPYVVEDADISTVFRSAHKFSTSIALEVPENNSGRIFLRNLFTTLGKPSTTLADYYITGTVFNNDKEVGIATISNDEVIGCGYLTQGSYVVKCEYELPFGVTPYSTTVSTEDVAIVEWLYDDEQKFIDIGKAGIRVKEGYATENLDKLNQELVKRVNVQNKLMPSLYRETDGNERFYVAENDKYKDEEWNDIVFKRPYSKDRPKEYILNNDEIFPTIEGMTNASGLRIDMFSEFAYDKDDNDEIYPEDYEDSNLAGKYKHPYFFGKLRKFNGEHGFNLFDHAIEGGEMTFSFKTGKVGGCNFKIGVDEDEGKYNLVQVYEVDTYEDGFGWHRKGELKRDENGNVLSGYAPNGGSQTPQACQQDTVNNEVWIALKKDVDTFGVLMPNAENSYRPSTEDTFVIINIDLPEAYVTAAEKRLEDEIIKHMSENNDYKFTFSAKLSRIFFAENEQFASELNENSKVSVEYDGVIYPMYVSSYSYTAKGSEILPEVSIELNDEIKIFKGAIARVKNEFKFVLGPTVDKIDIKLKETSNSLSSTTRIAKVANETATAAKTSSDELKVEIKDVGAVANGAKLSAENAQLSATQAKEGITAVGNEVGSLKTTVTSTQNIASNAQLTANNAMSEIGRVSNETSTKFNSVDSSINGIERDVNALEGLIGDEYNIWFENEGQQGSEPTLDNYPASDWTSDDDYFNHDKDLYYSITLGRAWRFMYNEGEPFWEEITDADTITALTKAKEALDKANEAIEAVHDLDYLKAVFGDTEVMNEHAVILSRLLAVSDDYENVVAGVYGGGVSGLDDNGYKDNNHGTLMMFAGADDAQHASIADFRVYSDGCIFANSGTFGGIMKRAQKVITRKNLNDFTYLDANETRVLDLTKTGSFITFGALSTTTNLSIRLPWYSSDADAGSIDDFDDLLSILGTKVIVRFTMPGDDFCFSTALFDNGTVAPQCIPVREASTFMFECKAGKDIIGTVNIGWEMTAL